MHPLTRDVVYATAIKRDIAKAAISCVLLFLRSSVPAEDTGGFLDRLRADVTAALRNSDHIESIDRLVNVEAQGCSDLGGLASKLLNLGLDPAQIIQMVGEVVAYAEKLADLTRDQELHEVLPALCEVFERMPESPACCVLHAPRGL